MASPIEWLERPRIGVAKLVTDIETEQATTNPFCGRATIASGDTTITVSGTRVNSDSLVFATGHLPIASHAMLNISVHSLNDSVSVTFGVEAAVVSDLELNWVSYQNLT